MRIDLAKFTLVGATTRLGLLTTPLRDRFGIPVRLNFYTVEELERVVTRGARVLGVPSVPTAPTRSPGARAARRASPAGCCAVCATSARSPARRSSIATLADKALTALEVDSEGLDALDRRYLSCIVKGHDGGPVGIETIAAALSEPRDALEEIVEPYLLQQGFISRTPRGRIATLKAYRHLGLSGPQRSSSPQGALFDVSDEDTGEDGAMAIRASDKVAPRAALCRRRHQSLAHLLRKNSAYVVHGSGRQSK